MSTSTAYLRSHRFAGLSAGPKLIVTGAVHGNEVAGTRGIERVLGEIERGELEIVRGVVTFVPICNPLAYQKGQRMGDRNLNRRLQPTATPQSYEDRISNVLCQLLADHDVLLDLHSFRSPGRPFVMRGPADNRDALEPFAHAAAEAQLAAHVGPNRIVEGWMSAYAAGVAKRRQRALTPGAVHEDPSYGVGTTEYMRSQGGYALTLECGQHNDPASPEVAYNAILRTLAHLQIVADAPMPAPRQDIEFLRLCEVTDRLHAGDAFSRAWTSFDRVQAGELIGTRHDGTPVTAPQDGFVVFPNSNAVAGNEWFYFAQASGRELGR